VDFGQVAVGIGSPIQTVTITNVGTGSGQLLTELTGPNPDDFFVARNGCNEVTLAPTESCTMDIMMIPLAGGRREAAVTV
ncbi:choice-of-anchor D domain-containing protein, partial [Staphylococcus aureus]